MANSIDITTEAGRAELRREAKVTRYSSAPIGRVSGMLGAALDEIDRLTAELAEAQTLVAIANWEPNLAVKLFDERDARVKADTARRCAEIASSIEAEHEDAWRAGHKADSHLEGLSDGAGEVAQEIRKEFGLEVKS